MAVVVAIVNDYHNQCKSIPKIAEEKFLTEFQVISALCDYAFKRKFLDNTNYNYINHCISEQGTLSCDMDLTGLIQHLYMEQSTVLDLMVLILDNPDRELRAKEVIAVSIFITIYGKFVFLIMAKLS